MPDYEKAMDSYSKRRSAIMKKLKVLEQNKTYGEGSREDIAYIRIHLPPKSQIKTKRQTKFALEMLERAEKSDLYSVRGRRRIDKRKIATLKEHGVEIGSRQELEEFSIFMETVREFSLNRIYDSTKAADIFQEGKDSGKTLKERFDEYKDFAKGRTRNGRD